MKTVLGIFERSQDIETVVGTLQNAGFASQSVNVLSSVGALWRHLGCTPARMIAKDFAIGAALGIAVYALFGVLVAVGEITMGFDQVVAIEALLIFVLLGIFVGGFLGAAFGLGAAEKDSREYVQTIRRGGALIVVRTSDEHADRAMDLLRQTAANHVTICARDGSEHESALATPPAKDRLSTWTRGTARVLGLSLIVLVLSIFIGQSLSSQEIPTPLTMSLTEDFLSLALIMALLGIVVAWRWEGIGGLLIVGSVMLFESINAIVTGRWQFDLLHSLLLLVGALYLWDWWRTVGRELDRHNTRYV